MGSDEIIRHGGIALCDIIATHMVRNNAMLDNLICDYEHHCWVLTIKWRGKFFDLNIYSFCGLMIRFDRSQGSDIYLQLTKHIHNFLSKDDRFSEVEWRTDFDHTPFQTSA